MQINGTFSRSVNAGKRPIRKEGRGNNIEALIIPALSQFNGTTILYDINIEPKWNSGFH